MARCTSWDLCLLAWLCVDGRVSNTCDATATAFRALGNKGSNLKLWWPWTFWSVKMIPANSLRLLRDAGREFSYCVSCGEGLPPPERGSSIFYRVGMCLKDWKQGYVEGYDIIQKLISPRDGRTPFLFLCVFCFWFAFFVVFFFSLLSFCLFVSCQGFFLCLN